MPKYRAIAYLAMLVNALFWGMSAPIIKHAFNYISPISFLALRFTLVFLLTTPFFVLYILNHKIKWKNSGRLLLMAFLANPLNLYLMFLGLERTSALEGAVLSSLNPVFFAVMCTIFLKEKVTKQEKFGLILAMFGTLVFTVEPLISTKTNNHYSLNGNLLIILGQIVYILAMILAKKDKHHSPAVQAYVSWFMSFLFFVPIAFFSNRNLVFDFPALIQNPAWPHILYMAVFGTIIAFWAYLYGQSKMEVSEASIFFYLQPLFAAPLAVFWLGEKFTLLLVLGCLLIIAGVILSQCKYKLIK